MVWLVSVTFIYVKFTIFTTHKLVEKIMIKVMLQFDNM